MHNARCVGICEVQVSVTNDFATLDYQICGTVAGNPCDHSLRSTREHDFKESSTLSVFAVKKFWELERIFHLSSTI